MTKYDEFLEKAREKRRKPVQTEDFSLFFDELLSTNHEFRSCFNVCTMNDQHKSAKVIFDFIKNNKSYFNNFNYLDMRDLPSFFVFCGLEEVGTHSESTSFNTIDDQAIAASKSIFNKKVDYLGFFGPGFLFFLS